ncbi:MAG TPA: glycosyltransferase family 1 protein [Candidatus Angelobacter sp.]|nr:glycosyltransferase family 1 protein [Candidatus Angelobacter sp.]
MRVGFDARWYNKSGVGSYVAGLLPALARAGCEVVAYIDPENPVPGLGKLDLRIVPVRSAKYSPLSSLEFRRREKEDKLDVFHCPFYATPMLKCPVVVTVHDLIPFLFPIYPWWKQRLVQAGYRRAARHAAHIVADSLATASDLEKILDVPRERISTIHLAADPETFHPHADPGEREQLQNKFGIKQPYVVVPGAGSWRTKNLKSALEAMAIARKDAGTEFQTVVFGSAEGLRVAAIRDLAHNLNVVQTGYVEVAELAALFRHAHALVMPSLYEGFGLPLVEAMVCGCPVIASDRGSLPEIAGAGAQCFDPFNINAMAVALVALLRSTEELGQKKAAALKRAADFSWDKAAQETIWVYHHVKHPDFCFINPKTP